MTDPGEDTPQLLPDVQPLTAFPPEPGDPGHLLPGSHWQLVQADAQRHAERIGRGQPPEEHRAAHGMATGLGLPLDGVVLAPSHGAVRGRPTFGVFHSMETPLAAGYAASIARYFAGGPGTSCHYTVDPAETWGVLPDTLIAWAVGTANTRSLNLEMAGRAAMTRAQWLTDDGMAQHRRAAAIVRHAHDEYGIGMYLMSDQQLLDAHAGRAVGGWATHDQCRRVIGGTTHTDPGSGCPVDVILNLATGGDDMELDTRFAVPGGTITVQEALARSFTALSAVDVMTAKGKTGGKIDLPLFLQWSDNNFASLRQALDTLTQQVQELAKRLPQ